MTMTKNVLFMKPKLQIQETDPPLLILVVNYTEQRQTVRKGKERSNILI